MLSTRKHYLTTEQNSQHDHAKAVARVKKSIVLIFQDYTISNFSAHLLRASHENHHDEKEKEVLLAESPSALKVSQVVIAK